METKVLWSAIQNAIEEARDIYLQIEDVLDRCRFYDEVLEKLYDAQRALPF